MALDDYLLEAEDKMMKTEQVVVNEFAGVRTGKASPSLVENILVEVYGAQMRIRELAGITTPEPRALTIQQDPVRVNVAHDICSRDGFQTGVPGARVSAGRIRPRVCWGRRDAGNVSLLRWFWL